MSGRPCFNSTLVRFKGTLATLPAGNVTRFQFHIGSIQSLTVIGERFRYCMSFNSTLVRFKALLFPGTIKVQVMFQFHIGSIQSGKLCEDTGRALTGFNSTLVRFKGLSCSVVFALLNLVSIPHWFDSKKHDFNTASENLSLVSIPHWFDSKSDSANFLSIIY